MVGGEGLGGCDPREDDEGAGSTTRLTLPVGSGVVGWCEGVAVVCLPTTAGEERGGTAFWVCHGGEERGRRLVPAPRTPPPPRSLADDDAGKEDDESDRARPSGKKGTTLGMAAVVGVGRPPPRTGVDGADACVEGKGRRRGEWERGPAAASGRDPTRTIRPPDDEACGGGADGRGGVVRGVGLDKAEAEEEDDGRPRDDTGKPGGHAPGGSR